MTDAKMEESYRAALVAATKEVVGLEAEQAGVQYRVKTCSVFRSMNSKWTLKAVMHGTSRRDEIVVNWTVTDEFMSGCWEEHGPDLGKLLMAGTVKRMFQAEIARVV
jgi:hypothetical protein